jgi:hypothetical protein
VDLLGPETLWSLCGLVFDLLSSTSSRSPEPFGRRELSEDVDVAVAGMTNPNPSVVLNYFTVPVAMVLPRFSMLLILGGRCANPATTNRRREPNYPADTMAKDDRAQPTTTMDPFVTSRHCLPQP